MVPALLALDKLSQLAGWACPAHLQQDPLAGSCEAPTGIADGPRPSVRAGFSSRRSAGRRDQVFFAALGRASGPVFFAALGHAVAV